MKKEAEMIKVCPWEFLKFLIAFRYFSYLGCDCYNNFFSCWEHYRICKDVTDTAVVGSSSMENNENLF